MEEHLPEKAIPHRTMNSRISEKKIVAKRYQNTLPKSDFPNKLPRIPPKKLPKIHS